MADDIVEIQNAFHGQRIQTVTQQVDRLVFGATDGRKIYVGWDATGPFVEKIEMSVIIPDVTVDRVVVNGA